MNLSLGNNKESSQSVSVVVAVFNGVDSIEKTLNSIFEQSHKDYEVIVIDGGSNDGTQEKIKPFLKKISYYISEKDDGIGDAWNKGVAQSNCEYVAILNCGDYWDKDFLKNHLENFPIGEDVIQYGTTYMVDNGEIVDKIDAVFDINKIKDGFGFIHTSILTSLNVYKKVGAFDARKKIAIDTDWMLRALRMGTSFRKVKVFNFMEVGGISTKQWRKGQYEYMDSLKESGFLNGNNIALKIKKNLQYIYMRLGINYFKKILIMQLSLCFVALVNFVSRVSPFHYPRRLSWKICGIKFSSNVKIHQNVKIFARRNLFIDSGTIINNGVFIDNRHLVRIGKNVSIAHDCRIYTTGHDVNSPDFSIKGDPVIIEDYAVLFAGAVLMPGVRIGKGAVILPFSVVTKDVPDDAIMGGTPAVIKNYRTCSLQYKLDYPYWFAV